MTEVTNLGTNTSIGDVNWRTILPRNGNRGEDPTMTKLSNQAKNLLNINCENNEDKNDELDKDLFILKVNSFNEYCKTNKYNFTLEIINEKKAKNNKKVSSKEKTLLQVKETKFKKKLESLIKSFDLNPPDFLPIFDKNSKDKINLFLILCNWTLYLKKNTKKSINLNVYLNCIISFYKCLIEYTNFLPENIIESSFKLLDELEIIFNEKLQKEKLNLKDYLLQESIFLLESFWDKNKTNSTELYEEQKYIIKKILNNLNSTYLIELTTPPGRGKTLLAVLIAVAVAGKKIVLYACYNDIVTTNVAKLAIMNNVNVKICMANTRLDNVDNIKKTFVRPFMNCYPLWNQQHLRTSDENKYFKDNRINKYNQDLLKQFEFFINDTKPRHSKILYGINSLLELTNRFDMFICDLESTYNLLKFFNDIRNNNPDLFPNDMFILFFDEAFATSDSPVTAKIMSEMNSTILASATLAEPSEIPNVISNFKLRHNLTNDDFLDVIKLDEQYISATFVDENGKVFPPHNNITNLDDLSIFCERSLVHPLIQRGYSPEIVLNISKLIDNDLPEELKFNSKFKYVGMINHKTLRFYGIELINYINNTRNDDLFNRIKQINITKINDMDINNIFTTSAINYQLSNTLHVSSYENFQNHYYEISSRFLMNSPELSDIIDTYKKNLNNLKKDLDNLNKNGKADDEYERNLKNEEISNLKIEWPKEFIFNSKAHANKFNNLHKLVNPNQNYFVKIDDLDSLNEIAGKLLFSNIGIYEPESNNFKLDMFLEKIELFKFIISNPSIVYGTNLGISIVDIDKSFVDYSTKNILYQLIGRAGRKGKSTSALIIFRDNQMLDKILEYTDFNVEAMNVEENFLNIINSN